MSGRSMCTRGSNTRSYRLSMRARRVLVATLIIGGCGDGGSASESIPPSAPATTATPSTAPPPTTLAVPTSSATSVTAATTAPPTSPPPPPTSPPTTLVPPREGELNGDWQVTSGVVNGVPVRLIDSAPITLTVVGFDLSGIAACNDYDFTADFGDGSVDIVTGSVTSMGCLAAGVT